MKTLSVITVCALASFGTVQARADGFKPSPADQVKLGKRAADELRQKEKVLPSSDERVQLVRRIGRKLLDQVDYKGKPWEFTFDVIQSNEVNAFALPGGPVFVYTGLLNKLQTEDELAGVMGHELTHVLKEHWASAYADSQKRNLILNLALIFARANNTAANIASITNELVFSLPYSRRAESEADDMGFETMVKAGYNPQGMADVFAMFQKMSKSGAPPEFLSDHPADAKRVDHIENKIQNSGRTYPAQKPLRFSEYSLRLAA